jgi:hypothetical protein
MKRVILLMSDKDAAEIAWNDEVGNGIYLSDGLSGGQSWQILDIAVEDANPLEVHRQEQ